MYEKDNESAESVEDQGIEKETAISDRESSFDNTNNNREFDRSIWTKMRFTWRFLANAITTLAFITYSFYASSSHYNFLNDLFKISNDTVRIDLVFGISEAFQR